MKRMLKFVSLFLSLLAVAPSLADAQAPRNILWDGGFDLGFGNNCWGVGPWNEGPNRRDLWHDGKLRLRTTVVSRLYWLDEGTYTLALWARREQAADDGRLRVTVSNLNHYDSQTRNEYQQTLQVPPQGWQRVHWTFTVQAPVRPYFHVEIADNANLWLDAVTLTRGDQPPAAPVYHQDAIAGFLVPEETMIYTDGEDRVVELLVHNHTPAPLQTRAAWQIYDHREQLVKQDVFIAQVPPRQTVRHRLPLDDLPWDGYRFACKVEGEDRPVLGDALLAILPKIDNRSLPSWGGDANVHPDVVEFSSRWASKLGMNTFNTLSAGSIHGRWEKAATAPGEHVYLDATVDVPARYGIEVLGFLGMRYAPPWVREQTMSQTGGRLRVVDDKAFLDAYCQHLESYLRHFGSRVKTIYVEDEVHAAIFKYFGEDWDRFIAAIQRVHDTAHRVADQLGVELAIGVNATYPEFWAEFMRRMPHEQIDVIAANTVLRPQYVAETLNEARHLGVYVPWYRTAGVGQRSQIRATSLIVDQATNNGNAAGLFAWQAALHFWQNRPHGTDDVRLGPLVDFGYYDLRALGQSVYMPSAGKTGLEYDNSPTLGMQAIAMLKYQTLGMRPVRDASQPFSTAGRPTRSEGFFAYPFRDAKRATILLMPEDGVDLDVPWAFTGTDFSKLDVRDLYAQPIAPADDGSLHPHELPVYVHTNMSDLPEVLAALRRVSAKPAPGPQRHRVAVGAYAVDVDPDRPGVFRLSRQVGDQERVLIQGFSGRPAFVKPIVDVLQQRTTATVRLDMNHHSKSKSDYQVLVINLSPTGASLLWKDRSSEDRVMQQALTLRLGDGGAGERLVYAVGDQVTTGRLREDYGTIYEAATTTRATGLEPTAAKLAIENFATFDLPPAAGNQHFEPKHGMRFVRRDGEALLESEYELGAFTGGGGDGVSHIELTVLVK